jgi:hypothetical protein
MLRLDIGKVTLQNHKLQDVINRMALTNGSETLYCNFMVMVDSLYQRLDNEEL